MTSITTDLLKWNRTETDILRADGEKNNFTSELYEVFQTISPYMCNGRNQDGATDDANSSGVTLECVNKTLSFHQKNQTFNETVKELDSFQITVVILLIMLIVVIVIGNTLIILAVLTTKRLRTVTNCFVTSLALADLLVGIFVMPPAIAVHVREKWDLGWIMCDIWISLDILLCTASILSLCAISIDRYLAVTRPLTYSRRRRSKKLALTMILFVWVAAGAITCPPMLGWYDEGHNKEGHCRYNQNPGYVVFSAMGSFFLPMTVMVYVYARISCVVARRHHQLANTGIKLKKSRLSCIRAESDSLSLDRNSSRQQTIKAKSSTPQPQNGNPAEEKLNNVQSNKSRNPKEPRLYADLQIRSNPNFKSRRTFSNREHSENNRVSSLRRETKTAQTLSLVVGGFVACWLPFFTTYILTPFVPPKYVNELVMYVLTWLGWFNSAINPFIYAFYSPDFRLAFWRLTIKKCHKRH